VLAQIHPYLMLQDVRTMSSQFSKRKKKDFQTQELVHRTTIHSGFVFTVQFKI